MVRFTMRVAVQSFGVPLSTVQVSLGTTTCTTVTVTCTDLYRNYSSKRYGFSVRFVKDASTASTDKYSNTITVYPNPTTSIVTLQGGKQYNIEVYDLLGNKVLETQGNSINMEHLSSATYIVKALDKVENEEVSYKVVKN